MFRFIIFCNYYLC